MTARRRPLSNENGGWHFIRTLSIDTIVQIVGMALVVGGPVLIWGRAIESRVLTIENFNTASAAADMKRDADTREQRQAFNARMEKIETTLTDLKVVAAQVLAAQSTAASLAAQARASPRQGR